MLSALTLSIKKATVFHVPDDVRAIGRHAAHPEGRRIHVGAGPKVGQAAAWKPEVAVENPYERKVYTAPEVM